MIDRTATSGLASCTAGHCRPLIGRRFVALSLLVHLLALALLPGLTGQSNPTFTPAPLTVRLSTPLLQTGVSTDAVRTRAAGNTEGSPATARPRQKPSDALSPARESIAIANDGGHSSVAPSIPPAMALTTPPAEPSPTGSVALASTPATALATTAPSAARERRGKPSTLWLAEYTEALSGQVGRVKQYPAVARLRGWQGTAVVAIRLAADGTIVDTRITQSTGHDILDRQALAMVRQAEPMPPLPEVDGEPLLVQLPIVFALAPRE